MEDIRFKQLLYAFVLVALLIAFVFVCLFVGGAIRLRTEKFKPILISGDYYYDDDFDEFSGEVNSGDNSGELSGDASGEKKEVQLNRFQQRYEELGL